jgi:ribosomal protein S18 acetylase RimI-like enzyme
VVDDELRIGATVRPARLEDEAPLARIDRATWTWLTSPSPPPPATRPFFDASTRPDDVLVAELDGTVAGYARLGHPTSLAASTHVLMITGLAVDPDLQGRGVGAALLDGVLAEARRRGARKLSLRVLGENDAARRLYERAGYEVEGVLRGEFHLEGRDVDDVLMARPVD